MKKVKLLSLGCAFCFMVAGVAFLATGCGESSKELTFVDATEASCETAGNNAYYYDAESGKFYQDAEGTIELSYEDDIVIAATGHDYVATYNTTTLQYDLVCSHDATHTTTVAAGTSEEYAYLVGDNYSSFDDISAILNPTTAVTTDVVYVKLASDVVIDSTVVVTRTVSLDMNGKTLANTKEIWNTPTNSWSLVSVRNSYTSSDVDGATANTLVNSGDLTIKGNGTFATLANDCYCVDVQSEGAKLTIENGTYVGNCHAVYIYKGEASIYGGYYTIQQVDSTDYNCVINCQDDNFSAGIANCVIYGGSYDRFDPINHGGIGTEGSLLASGYTTTTSTNESGNTIYTVIEVQ